MKGLFVFLFFGFLMGCTSAGLVTTTHAPKPAITAPVMSSQPMFGAVSVNLSAGGLAFGIDKLNFRIREVRFENAEGAWTSITSHAGLLSLTNESNDFPLLSTKLRVGNWKSMAVVIDRVYAQYNQYAGGPLNVSENESLVIKRIFDITTDNSTEINLTLDTASSIWKDDTGRWFFVPVILAD